MAKKITRTTNPRNPQNLLFRKLTRLFSGPIVRHDQQNPHKFKKSGSTPYRFKSSSGQSFKRDRYNPYDTMSANYMSNQNRADRYVDFDQMEYTPEIASALDIYADEMTTSTDIQPLMKIKCTNEEIKLVLENLYLSILNVEFNMFNWARTMCKYGDFFLYLDIDEERGVQYAIGLPSHEVERIEGEDKTNPNYIQYQWNAGGITFENWQIAHFRVLGNDKYTPYGTSICEPARRIWRQLTLMEDAVMAYRIVRSPERRVFYIDVGAIAPEDVEQYMQKVMSQMKRNTILDADTGRVDLRYNPMSVEEDYFIPVRGQVNSKIESLPGGTYTGDIDDIKYLRDKLFSALKVPASYLSRAEGAEEDKTTLAQKDIRFARTIQRLQRSLLAELEKVGIIHLFTLGYRGKDLTTFKISLNNPSKIAELQDLEHWRTKFEIAGSATEGYFSRRWIAENLFKLSEEELQRLQRESFYDRTYEAELEKVAEAVAAEGSLGGPAGPLDIDGAMDPGETDAEGEEPPPTSAGDGMEDTLAGEDTGMADEEASDSMLLASPGKRDDDLTTTPASNGKWYMPIRNRRNFSDKRKSAGPRTRHLNSLAGDQMASATKRNIFKGYSQIDQLAKGIVSEGLDEFYEHEREKIFDERYEIKKLINNMEIKKDAA